MRKCAICKTNDTIWTWQPFGPDTGLDCFTAPGYHYRGFPAIHCCDKCKREFQAGKSGSFEYRGALYKFSQREIVNVVSSK